MNCYYAWHLNDHHVEGHLRKQSLSSPLRGNWKVSEYLHCTAAFPSCEDDTEYQQRWSKQKEKVEITMNGVYRGEDFVAAGVLLMDTQMSLYEVPGSVPHCSLSKAPEKQWKDVGIWMKK